jgi:hypothetical protein
MRRKQDGPVKQLPLQLDGVDKEAPALPEPRRHDLVETLADLMLGAVAAGMRRKVEQADEPENRA